jgi:hypothetical protein
MLVMVIRHGIGQAHGEARSTQCLQATLLCSSNAGAGIAVISALGTSRRATVWVGLTWKLDLMLGLPLPTALSEVEDPDGAASPAEPPMAVGS